MNKEMILDQMILACRELDMDANPELKEALDHARQVRTKENHSEEEISSVLKELSQALKNTKRVLN